MKTFRTLVCSILALWMNASFARDYVVLVAVVDGEAVRAVDVERVRKILEDRHGKKFDVRTVSVPVPGPRESADAAGLKVTERLDELAFSKGQRVRMLVVQAPGGVFAGQTELESLGKFTADGADVRLRTTFAPLIGHFTRYARIVLTGFTSLADAEGTSRAGGLLRDFGAPDGSYVGLVTAEAPAPLAKAIAWRTRLVALGSAGVGLVAAGVALYAGEPGAIVPFFATYGGGTFIGVATVAAVLDRALPLFNTLIARRGAGRVVRLRDGLTTSIDRLSIRRAKQVYDCQDHLGGV